RIEIVKGPRSTLYGSDAMGGTVNVITRRHDGSGAALQSRLGAFGTRDVTGSAQYSAAAGGLRLQASQLESDGFAPHNDSTEDRGHRNTTINAGGDLALGAVTLAARAWNAQGNTEYLEDPNPFCFPCAYTSPAALDFHNRALAVEGGWNAATLESRLHLEQTLDENEIVAGIFAPSTTRNERSQARWHNAWTPAQWARLSLGLETAHERTTGSGLTEVRDVNTVYLQDELNAGAHRALVAASALDHEAFGTVRLWNLEYGYELATDTRLSLGAGTGFRAPNVFERFFPGFGNPDLRPERARSYELGLRQNFGPAQRLDLRAFRTDYQDLIAFDPATFLAGNVSRVTLITDAGHAIPVLNSRSGLRALVFGTGNPDTVKVPYRTANAGQTRAHGWQHFDHEHWSCDVLFDYWTISGDAWAKEELRQLGES
ncbi:MAG: TonB-dependent receptor, partial [Hydrocarboniphaga effusa]|nr:TonB-dependent receptor [Hydrocarboniphaga effusa]